MTSVGDYLGLGETSDLLDQARSRWPAWVGLDQRLAAVDGLDDLLSWREDAPLDEVDEVLLALAMLAAPDGGDDLSAAAALARCLLPGAVRIARSLCQAGLPIPTDTIDELVASQLWIEVRSFSWRRLTKVVANILTNTRVGVMRDAGISAYLKPVDQSWAHTTPVGTLQEPTTEDGPVRGLASVAVRLLEPAAAGEEEPAGPEGLLEVLDWACRNEVISDQDRYLLLCLVEEAARVGFRDSGCGGLASGKLAALVAPRVGRSVGTIRRHAARSVKALAEAAPGKFGHDE
ncbi:MAG: hypothetical protein L0H74_00615 [Brachybacterium sp.]|nr:hypothetical protein [Brachybacterium sp.]